MLRVKLSGTGLATPYLRAFARFQVAAFARFRRQLYKCAAMASTASTKESAHRVPSGQLRRALAAWARRDLAAILLYLLATLLATYPLALKLGSNWLAYRDIDTFMKLWDNWWLGSQAIPDRAFTSTNTLFYPLGLDLSFHSISWTVALLSNALSAAVGEITAYNLTVLLAVFSTAYAAYLLIYELLENRPAAWLGGAIYSFAPYHMAHTGGHPDLVFLAPIPLAILLLILAIRKSNGWLSFGAALMIGIAAFTSLYIMDFLLLTMGPIVLFMALEKGRWRHGAFWRTLLIAGVVALPLLALRLAPVFQEQGALSLAIESKYAAAQNQTDLLSFVLPTHFNPIFAPFAGEIASRMPMNSKWPAYLGIVPLALALFALTSKKYRANVLLWFAIGLMFVLLALGPVLRFNGRVFDDLAMPAALVARLPPIRAVARPDFFVLGVLLPLAVCAAYGFDRLLRLVAQRRLARLALLTAIPLLLLLEYWNGPYPGIELEIDPFYEQIAAEEGDFALVQLPMGRRISKRYLYYQTVHGKPIVEGLGGRTPDEAYAYIDHNRLLRNWKEGVPLDCEGDTGKEIVAALEQLASDNFRYIIVHHSNGRVPEPFAAYLTAPPYYHDQGLTAYRLDDLQDNPPCLAVD
jgi:hypothetical protein